jgi:Tfp pilus assembly protein PilF
MEETLKDQLLNSQKPLIKPAFAEVSRGLAKLSLNDLTGALADVNKTLELNPDMAYAYTTRANINYKLNDYKT